MNELSFELNKINTAIESAFSDYKKNNTYAQASLDNIERDSGLWTTIASFASSAGTVLFAALKAFFTGAKFWTIVQQALCAIGGTMLGGLGVILVAGLAGGLVTYGVAKFHFDSLREGQKKILVEQVTSLKKKMEAYAKYKDNVMESVNAEVSVSIFDYQMMTGSLSSCIHTLSDTIKSSHKLFNEQVKQTNERNSDTLCEFKESFDELNEGMRARIKFTSDCTMSRKDKNLSNLHLSSSRGTNGGEIDLYTQHLDLGMVNVYHRMSCIENNLPVTDLTFVD